MRERTERRFTPTMPGCESVWQRLAKSTPTCADWKKNCEQGGVTYILDKSRLSIRLQAPYSEERRQKASEYAKKHGLNSQQE